MTTNSDSDMTLPSVVANLVGSYQVPALMLTIAFHPETDRIGESTLLPMGRGAKQWHIGRGTPYFSRSAGAEELSAERSLDDMYISRMSLQLDYANGALVVGREVDACRCQVAGVELEGSIELSADDLKAGVPIFLANRILLLLSATVKERLSAPKADVCSELIGSGPYITSLKEQIAAAAASDVDVFIRGETGTGKELVANAIHVNSARASTDMITVNMAAIPVALAPSALFGSAKGSFTGANSSSVGYFEQAQKGILFLDEIGDTPLEIQAQLLRALQQREIQPVGGTIKSIDCRVIAATDVPVDEGGDFKTALRHRLAGCEIVLGALRDHPEDIGELLWFFIEDYLKETAAMISLPGPDSDRLEVAAWAELFHVFLRYSWPGNVRQLANFARQISMASGAALVFPQHLRDELKADPRNLDVSLEISTPPTTRSEDVSEMELVEAMAKALYEPKAAAALLGMSRTAIYRRIDESDELRIAGDVSEEELQRALDTFDGNLNKAALDLRVSRVGLRFRVRSINKAKQ